MSEAIAETTRKRIISAAGEVFADRGYEAATVREICQNARTNVASVNYHFGDKRKLYEVCLDEARRQREALFPLPAIDDRLPLPARLVVYLDGILGRFLVSDPTSWEGRLLLREILQPSSAGRPLLEQVVRPQFEYLAGIVDLMAPQASAKDKAFACHFVVGQCILFRTAGPLIDFLTPELGPFSSPVELQGRIRELSLRIAAGICAILGKDCTADMDELLRCSLPRFISA